MALSGSVKTNSYNGRYYQLSWTATQSVSDNTSTISWTLSAAGGAVSWYAERTVKVIIDGSTAYSKTDYVERRTGTVKTGTVTLSHDTNGDKSFSINLQVACYYVAVNLTASGSFALNNIPRKSTLSVGNGTLGTAQTLTVSRQSSSFTHSIKTVCGSSTLYIKADGTTSTSEVKHSGTSISFTPPLSWASQNTTGTSLSVAYTITTYNGSTSIGSNSHSKTCTIPSSVKPTLSVSVSDSEGYSGTYGGYVQGKSKISVSLTAAGAYGSTIKSYSTTADGSKYTASSFTTGVIKGSGTLTISATVTDSRGRSATATKDIIVLDYSSPKISAIKAIRSDSSGNASSSGAYLTVIFSAEITSLNSNNTAEYTLQYKKTSENAYTDVTLSAYSGNYNVANGTYTFSAESSSSYDVIITATDDFGSVPLGTKGASIKKLWSILNRGLGFAFGKIAERQNAFECGFDMYDKFDTVIGNGLAEYTGSGDNAIDPNTTIEHCVLTNKNTPSSSQFWYVVTYFYNEKSGTGNRCQYCLPYKSIGSMYHRYYFDGAWSDWRRHVNEDEFGDAVPKVEKGTWTPTLAGDVSYTTRSGQYIKTGNLVWITCDIQLSSKGSTTTALTVIGLPFQPKSRSTLAESYDYATKTPQVAIAETTNYVRLTHDSSGSWGTTTHAYINDTFHVIFSGCYPI